MLAEESGRRDCSRDRRGRPLRVPRALLGTGDSASPPSSGGLQQLAPGPSLVRWARERRRAGGRSSPVPAPGGRAPRPPLARARVLSRRPRRRPGRERGTPPTERARTGESAAGASQRPAGAGSGGRGPLRMEGDKPANLGPQARRFPLGGGPLDCPNCDRVRTSHRHGHGKGFRNHRAWVCPQQQRGILGHAAGRGDWPRLFGRSVHVECSPGASEAATVSMTQFHRTFYKKQPIKPACLQRRLRFHPCPTFS
ncbi:translation initiation factor IF-2-like [Zalophus californianus]|uniref:Translation initiation factor IF-2-like n=1 Tax=Zalophus californianus TaxID=9704 RepID=A0A6J2BNT4_ZALCA|nr:translation initiation factor IF-2-like [Zalophus californianus]